MRKAGIMTSLLYWLTGVREASNLPPASGCYLKDNKATNGTYLNGARLDENAEQKLSNDAMISIGGEDFIFKLS